MWARDVAKSTQYIERQLKLHIPQAKQVNHVYLFDLPVHDAGSEFDSDTDGFDADDSMVGRGMQTYSHDTAVHTATTRRTKEPRNGSTRNSSTMSASDDFVTLGLVAQEQNREIAGLDIHAAMTSPYRGTSTPNKAPRGRATQPVRYLMVPVPVCYVLYLVGTCVTVCSGCAACGLHLCVGSGRMAATQTEVFAVHMMSAAHVV